MKTSIDDFTAAMMEDIKPAEKKTNALDIGKIIEDEARKAFEKLTNAPTGANDVDDADDADDVDDANDADDADDANDADDVDDLNN